MALSTQPYKGARDFYPEDKQLQTYMFEVMRTAVHKYGYEEYDAPILEPLELYKAKSGQEIVNEQTYNFVDRGGREVAIRPEMTPTVSRMVAARRQELPYPLRWYSIPNLWRYERPQRGRLREHWQLNVDIFGVEDISGDHEIIQIADSILKSFGATPDMYEIKVNSRELINELMYVYLGFEDERAHALIKLIDRMHKMNDDAFRAAVEEICVGTEGDMTNKIYELLQTKEINDLPESVHSHPSIGKLRSLLAMLNETGISNAIFDISLMRGFDYYTDIVFEVHDTHPENNRSMFGGGRYDGLVGLFGVEPIPTAGFGVGDVTLANFLTVHELLPSIIPTTDIVIATIGDVYIGASKLASKLREKNFNTSIDATNRKLDKKIKSIDKQGVRYVIFIGENELKEGVFNLKDMIKREEHQLNFADLVEYLENN